MSQVNRTANHCDVCGHEWLPQDGVAYSHCTSGKCRSRRWNSKNQPTVMRRYIRKPADVPAIVAESPKPKTVGHHPRCKCSLCA